MKTLYVHIGTPKTGTTSIQTFCRDNDNILNKYGYCYPVFSFYYPHCPKRRNGIFLEGMIFKNGNRDHAEEQHRLKTGLETVSQLFQKYDNVILSDEDLWRASYERRKTLWEELTTEGKKTGFTVKAVVYLRRQDTLVDSWYNQNVKGTALWTRTWMDFVNHIDEDRQLDYYSALNRIASSIGKENVIVRRFDRKYFPDGLIQLDFLNAIGLDLTDEYSTALMTANERLSGNTMEIKRILNTMPEMDLEYNIPFRRMLLKYAELSCDIYPNSMFSPDEAKAFVMQFQEGNRRIAEEYLHENGADLFDMNFKSTEKWEKNNPYMLDDVIRFVGESTIYLLDELDKLDKRLKIQEKRYNDLKYKLRHPFYTFFHILLRKLGIRS